MPIRRTTLPTGDKAAIIPDHEIRTLDDLHVAYDQAAKLLGREHLEVIHEGEAVAFLIDSPDHGTDR